MRFGPRTPSKTRYDWNHPDQWVRPLARHPVHAPSHLAVQQGRDRRAPAGPPPPQVDDPSRAPPGLSRCLSRQTSFLPGPSVHPSREFLFSWEVTGNRTRLRLTPAVVVSPGSFTVDPFRHDPLYDGRRESGRETGSRRERVRVYETRTHSEERTHVVPGRTRHARVHRRRVDDVSPGAGGGRRSEGSDKSRTLSTTVKDIDSRIGVD